MNDILILIVMGLALSMDAFAVSLCNGLYICGLKKSQGTIIALIFGTMQGIMPILGYYLGTLFLKYIEKYLPWISFAILTIIGIKMIIESIRKKEESKIKVFSLKSTLIQGVATSIDALTVGITLLTFSINIFICSATIATITFVVCLAAVYLGVKFGKLAKNTNIAQILGGIVLVLIGVSFLLR